MALVPLFPSARAAKSVIQPWDNPEEEQAFMDSVLGKAITPLQWLGETLDKPGRAVRGLLGGKTSELMNLIPFSDTFGLTDPSQQVTGRDLLEDSGLLEKNQEGLDFGDVAGFGAEVLLDPLTYVGIGAFTHAGKAALRAGKHTVPVASKFVKALGGSIDDLVARGVKTSAEVAQEASSLGKLAPTMSSRIRAGQQGLLSFMGKHVGTGEKAAQFAEKFLEPIGAKLKYGTPVISDAYRLFNRSVGGMKDPMGRYLHETITHPKIAEDTAKMLEPMLQTMREYMDTSVRVGDDVVPVGFSKQHSDFMRAGGEVKPHGAGHPLMTGLDSLEVALNGNAPISQIEAAMRAGTMYGDEVTEGILKSNVNVADKAHQLKSYSASLREASKYGEKLKNYATTTMVDQAKDLGINLNELVDEFIDYLPRFNHPEEHVGLIRGLFTSVKTHKGFFNKQRLDFLRGVPGGTWQLHELMRTPKIFDEAVSTLDEAAAEIVGRTHINDSEAKQIARWIRNLHKRFDGKYTSGVGGDAALPFFNADPITDMIIRTSRHAKQINQANFLHELVRHAGRHFDTPEQAALEGFVPLKNPNLAKAGEYLPPDEMADFMSMTGLTFDDLDLVNGTAVGFKRGAIREAAERLGLDPSDLENVGDHFETAFGALRHPRQQMPDFDVLPKGMKDIYMPKDLASDAARFFKLWKEPEELARLTQYWDNSLNLFKASVTQMWPAFHFRNILSGLYYHLAAGLGDQGFAPFKDAMRLMSGNTLSREMLDDLATRGVFDRSLGSADLIKSVEPPRGSDEWYDWATNNLVAQLEGRGVLRKGGTQAMEMVGGPVDRTVTGLAHSVPNTPQSGLEMLQKGVKSSFEGVKEGKGYGLDSKAARAAEGVIEMGRKAGNISEDWLRVSHYLAALKQGYSPDEAARSVYKWLFDYGDLTEFERTIMKRWMPFYTFTRKNLPLVLKELYFQPGGMLAQSVRASNIMRQKRGFIPKHIGEGLAIPLGEEGRFLSRLGLPFEQPFEQVRLAPDPSSTFGISVSKSIGRTFERQIGQLHPVVGGAYTFASGREPYFGRDVSDLYRYPTQHPYANALIAKTPASRGLTTFRKLLDERKSPGIRALNFGTGLQVTDVSGGMEAQKRFAMREAFLDYAKGGVPVGKKLVMTRRGEVEVQKPIVDVFSRVYATPGLEDQLLQDPTAVGFLRSQKSADIRRRLEGRGGQGGLTRQQNLLGSPLR